MATDDKIGRVPQALRARVDEIVAVVETVCVEHLDEEYAILCRRLVAKLARKRPSPVVRGDVDVWAGGVLYASVRTTSCLTRARLLTCPLRTSAI